MPDGFFSRWQLASMQLEKRALAPLMLFVYAFVLSIPLFLEPRSLRPALMIDDLVMPSLVAVFTGNSWCFIALRDAALRCRARFAAAVAASDSHPTAPDDDPGPVRVHVSDLVVAMVNASLTVLFLSHALNNGAYASLLLLTVCAANVSTWHLLRHMRFQIDAMLW